MKKYLLLFLLMCASAASAQTIADKLTTINNIKLDIKAALASKSQTVGDDFSVYDEAIASITTTDTSVYSPFIWTGGSDWTVATITTPVEFYNDFTSLASSIMDVSDTNVASYCYGEAYYLYKSGITGMLDTVGTFTQTTPGTIGTFTPGNIANNIDYAFSDVVIAPTGEAILIPYHSRNVYGCDPKTGAVRQLASTGTAGNVNNAFRGGVVTRDGRILLVPCVADLAVIFDPVKNTCTPASGTVSDFAYAGAALAKNGKIILCPNSATKVGIYDSDKNELMTGATVSAGAGEYYGLVPLPDGNMLFVPQATSTAGIYHVDTDSVTYASGTISGGSLLFRGGCLDSSGKKAILAPYYADKVGIYNIDTNELTSSTNIATTTDGAFTGCTLMPDGDVLLVPYVTTKIYLYSPDTDVTTEAGLVSSGEGHYSGARVTPQGKIILAPASSRYVGYYNNGFAPVPLNSAIHPMVNHP